MDDPNDRARMLALLRRLTPQEIELLRYRVSGWASVEIARELALPIDYARAVLGSVYDKLELTWDEQEPSLVTIARFGQLLPELAPPSEPPTTPPTPGAMAGPDDLTRQLPNVSPGQPLGPPAGPPPQPSGRALAMVDRDDEALLAQRAPVGSTAVMPPAGALLDDDEPVVAQRPARHDEPRDNTPLFVAGAAAIAVIALLLFLLFRAVGGDGDDNEPATEVAGGGSTVEAVVPTVAPTATQAQPTETPVPEEPTATPTEVPTEEPTATPTEEPTEEPTATPTEEPTKEPTATPTEEPPAPTPAPSPQEGALAFEANWNAGPGDWGVENGWTIEDGALVGDGEAGSLPAPFEPATPNYAVEADLTILDGNDRCPAGVGVFARRTHQSTAGVTFDAGYVGTLCDNGWELAATRTLIGVLDRLDGGSFQPGDAQHTVRLEINGERLRLFIDGTFMGEANDDRWTEPGETGLYVTGDYRVRVTSFRVFDLPGE